MIKRLDKKLVPVGPVLFALAIAVYKATVLTFAIGAGLQTLLVLTGLDLVFITLLLLLAILHAKSRGAALFRIVLRVLLVLMTGIYLVDSFVLLALDDHAANACPDSLRVSYSFNG